MQPHLILNVLQNPHNLMVVRQKGAKEASPPKAKSLQRASPKDKSKGKSKGKN